MVYIIAMLVYFGVVEPHYSVYRGLIFSNMVNCHQYVENHQAEMSHELWETHKESRIGDETRKLKNFRIECVLKKAPPMWKDV